MKKRPKIHSRREWTPSDYIALISTVVAVVSLYFNLELTKQNRTLRLRVGVYTDLLDQIPKINSLTYQEFRNQHSPEYQAFLELEQSSAKVRAFSGRNVVPKFNAYLGVLDEARKGPIKNYSQEQSDEWNKNLCVRGTDLVNAISADIND